MIFYTHRSVTQAVSGCSCSVWTCSSWCCDAPDPSRADVPRSGCCRRAARATCPRSCCWSARTWAAPRPSSPRQVRRRECRFQNEWRRPVPLFDGTLGDEYDDWNDLTEHSLGELRLRDRALSLHTLVAEKVGRCRGVEVDTPVELEVDTPVELAKNTFSMREGFYF